MPTNQPTNDQMISEWRRNRDRAAKLVRKIDKLDGDYLNQMFVATIDAKSWADISGLIATHPEADTLFLLYLRLGMATAMVHAHVEDTEARK